MPPQMVALIVLINTLEACHGKSITTTPDFSVDMVSNNELATHEGKEFILTLSVSLTYCLEGGTDEKHTHLYMTIGKPAKGNHWRVYPDPEHGQGIYFLCAENGQGKPVFEVTYGYDVDVTVMQFPRIQIDGPNLSLKPSQVMG